MAGRSIKRPVEVVYDVLVKVDMFFFSADFAILDCEIDIEVPMILGRPFFDTGKALVDVEGGELKFRVNEKDVTFNIYKSMKYPSDMHVVSYLDQIDEAMTCIGELAYNGESFAAVVLHYNEK